MTSITEERELDAVAIKIVVFDMDGVLVDIDSSWRFVHKRFGKENEENLRQYLDHRIDYAELLKRDVDLWGRINVDSLRGILAEAPLMNGAARTVNELRRKGYKTAIISAGISVLAERLQTLLGIDYAFASKIAVDETGVIVGASSGAVELLNKVAPLKKLVQREKTTLSSCAVVGDSVFDIPLFEAAGLSIAFNTNDRRVIEAADFVVEEKDLAGILRYL